MNNAGRPIPTYETQKLIDRWESARRSVADSRRRLARAEVELDNAANALGKFLAPSNAEMSEIFCVWVGGRILSIAANGPSCIGLADYRIEWRPDSK